MKRAPLLLLIGFLLLGCLPLIAQNEINRYTLYTGFDYMLSPARNLTERGFDTDFGVTAKPWLGLGADFGVLSGAGTINGSETVYAGPVNKSGFVPGGARSINVAFNSTTYTFAAGPQIYIRRWPKVTLLIRPGLGGMHEKADINFPSALVPLFYGLNLPLPSRHQSDTQLFVGMGGGFDVNVSHKMAVRFTADWVNTHLFSNLLSPRQNYVRFSIGPAFRWGKLSENN